jgi:hypothetical protein
MDLENLIRDTLDQIRPKYHIPETYQEAVEQLEKLEAEYRAKIGTYC